MKQREIKFRGYATGIGWVYGSLVNNLWTYSELSQYEKGSACCEIITGKYEGDCWEDIAQQDGEAIISVIPETVGEFIGLKDKSGKEIYEGDKLITPFGEGIIVWNEDVSSFQYAYNAIGKGTAIGGRMTNTLYKHDEQKYEIIGTIYDNAGLLAVAP